MSSSKRPAKRPARKASGPASRAPAVRPAARSEGGGPASAPRRTSAGPPASARITIKPGPPRRPPFELPRRLQPGGWRPLSEVVLDEDEVLTDPFDATLHGAKVRVTAVLERTCVYLGQEGERRLASKQDVWVEADKLPIRRRGVG